MDISRLQRLSLFELLKLAGELYGRHLPLWFGVALLSQAMVLLMALLLNLQQEQIGAGTLGLSLLVSVLSDGVSVMLLTLAVGFAVCKEGGGEKSKGDAPPLGMVGLLKFAAAAPWVGVLLTYLAASFIGVVGFILMIIPGVLLGALFQLAVCVALWETPLPHAALARSASLTRADFFTSLGLFTSLFFVVKLLPLILVLIQNSWFPGPFSPLLIVIFSSLAAPFGVAAQVLFYLSRLQMQPLKSWQQQMHSAV